MACLVTLFAALHVATTVAAAASLPWPSITKSTLRPLLIDSTGPLAVVIHRSGERQKSALDALVTDGGVHEAAAALEGVVPFATLDVGTDAGKELQQVYHFAPLPAVALFNGDLTEVRDSPSAGGVGKGGNVLYMKLPLTFPQRERPPRDAHTPTDGGGGGGEAGRLVRWILSNLSTRAVRYVRSPHDAATYLTSLDNTTMRRVPQLMLFLKAGEPPPPSFLVRAQEWRYRALWAVVSAEAGDTMAEAYNVTVRPALVAVVSQPHGAVRRLHTLPLFRPPSADDERGPTVRRVFVGHDALAAFLETHALNATAAAAVREGLMYVYSTHFSEIAEAEKALRAPQPIVPLRHATRWASECLGVRKGHCLVVFAAPSTAELSGGSSISTRDLSDLARSWQRRRDAPLASVVVDGVANAEIAAALGVVNGLPDVVVVHPARRRFARLQGAPSAQGVGRWLNDVASWRWHALPSAMPPFTEAADVGGGDL